ncbi:MAG: 50S ribosomal protein L28 [Thermoanaerobaculaceae bacterium]
MARVCELCGKSIMTGRQISHAHNVSKKCWRPNLHVVRARFGTTTRRVKVCTRCLRSGHIHKAVH